jgi:hypothetical protein
MTGTALSRFGASKTRILRLNPHFDPRMTLIFNDFGSMVNTIRGVRPLGVLLRRLPRLARVSFVDVI